MTKLNTILIILLFIACNTSHNRNTQILDAEYDVIAAVIENKFKEEPDLKSVVIVNETYIEGEDFGTRQEIDSTQNSTNLGYYNLMLVDSAFGQNYKKIMDFEELIQNYKIKNKNKSVFDLSKLNIRFNTSSISRKELHSTFSDNLVGYNWEKFYLKYPDALGFFKISRVGLNKNNDEAIIWVEINRGSLNATFDYYFLRKTGDSWKTIKIDNCGIS